MNKHTPTPLLFARSGCSIAVVIVAIFIAILLVKSRPETQTQEPEEPVLAVNLQTVRPTELVVDIETQGIVKPVRKVMLSPQVGGEVLEMPVELKAGDLVKKDQLLLKINPVDYETALAEARSAVSRIEAGLSLLDINEKADQAQLKLSERSRDLTRKDYERTKKLSDEGQAVSVSVVESNERALTQSESQVLQLRQSLAQVPSRKKELQSELAAAKARVKQNELQWARTSIRSPFDARVIESRVEIGEVLNPGEMIFELADDSSLEIAVPVTASDLRNWIPFEKRSPADQGWFPPLQKVPVSIRWSESSQDLEWQGRLDRLIRFDATTRTAMLAVRISGEQLVARDSGLPLTEGMFCQVSIPGKELKNVFKLPRTAVTFDNQCYVEKDGKLKTVQVTIARSQGDDVYISDGIASGDRVITTRLVAPLEGIKLVEAGGEE
ncbi:HlyD family efflux transporter periplasmic adaptor subunit [Kiritimatiellaeota bacterium B1221]|nr:HlyD family efflux transporter periplasmic adaptor subunit [Kiritimatiellaeota bacterium B1221]